MTVSLKIILIATFFLGCSERSFLEQGVINNRFSTIYNNKIGSASKSKDANLSSTEIRRRHSSVQHDPDNNQSQGVYFGDGKILVKARGSSFLSLIDQVFYQYRLNYTIRGTLPQDRLIIAKDHNLSRYNLMDDDDIAVEKKEYATAEQKEFMSIETFVHYLQEEANKQAKEQVNQQAQEKDALYSNDLNATPTTPEISCKYNFKRNSDGYLFEGNCPNHANIDTIEYKKIFLNNITAEEAMNKAEFFGDREIMKSQNFNSQQSFTGSGSDQKGLKETNVGSFNLKQELEVYGKDDKLRIVALPFQNALLLKGIKGVSDSYSSLDKLSDMMTAIDAPYPQILIEARIFQYDEEIGRKIGMAIETTNNQVSGDTSRPFLGFAFPFLNGINQNLFYSMTDNEKKITILSKLALEDKESSVKIIAEPRVLMRPGVTSEIILTNDKKVKIVEVATQGGYPSASSIDVTAGTKLTITPSVLSPSSVLLNIILQHSEFLPSTEDGVLTNINNNTIKVSAIATDKELLSLGGIYQDKGVESEVGIPLLKNIPYLGRFFGSSAKGHTRSLTDFMIRATIKNVKIRNEGISEQVNSFDKEKR